MMKVGKNLNNIIAYDVFDKLTDLLHADKVTLINMDVEDESDLIIYNIIVDTMEQFNLNLS